MNYNLKQLVGLLSLVFLLSCKKEAEEKIEAIQYKASGDIAPKLAEFRTSLGQLNTTPGATGGRREINWDGVPDTLLNKRLPSNFFNPVGSGASASLQRGLLYGEGDFEVSATNFLHINSEAATEFQAFSGAKVFANVSEFAWPVGFQVAGQNKAAFVSAFGMVFSDVDVEGSATLEFFDGEKSLGEFGVPAHGNSTKFSFLGVQFPNHKITKVRVHHQGRLVEGKKDISQGGTDDLIVIDDLIYSEPVAL